MRYNNTIKWHVYEIIISSLRKKQAGNTVPPRPIKTKLIVQKF